jgi:cobalt/nickel transport system permease protein
VALILTAIAAASRVPALFLARRLLLLEPFVLGVAILSLLQPGGLAIFLRLVVRGTLCLGAVLLLSSTTPFSEILRVFRKLRLPAVLITMLALMYRYVFVLVDEAERMSRARASRTFRRDRHGAWQSRASVIGQLFVRSTARAERIYAAMCARGWRT